MARRLEEGAILAGFRLERMLGAGGMGAVFLATDERLKRRVALKVVAPQLADDARYRTRFLLEAELAARLDHPAIVPIYHMGEADGQLFLAMRYVEGGTLTGHLQELGPLTPGETLALLTPIADALDAAHGAGLIHRDVKPGNILLEDGRAYLADFGLARPAADAADSVASAVGTQLSGTLGYLSPEQIEGQRLTSAVDQYALACVAFQCLTGREPFDGDDLALVYAHLAEPPPSATELQRDLPRDVDAVLARGLAKAPEERFPSCTGMVDALAEACGLKPRVTAAGRSARRRLLVGAGAVVAALAAVAGLLVVTHGGGHQGARTARPADPVFIMNATNRSISSVVNGGATPSDITEGGGAIWVLNGQNRTVTRVAQNAPDEPQTIGVGVSPISVTYGEGAVWVSGSSPQKAANSSYASSVVEIDPATLRASVPIPLPPPASLSQLVPGNGGGIWAGSGAVWVVDAVGDIVRIDPATRQQTNVAHGLRAWTVFGDATSVWALGDERVLHRLDPDTGKPTGTNIPVQNGGGDLGSPGIGGGALWVPSRIDGVVRRIDVATRATHDFRVHPNIDWLQYVEGRIWGIDGVDGLMLEFDPATGKVLTRSIEGEPVSFVATPQHIVVATNGVSCGPLQHAPGVRPRLTIVSDLPLSGDDGAGGPPLADAAVAVLRAHGFRAGEYSLGYRSCDYGTVNGGWSEGLCSAHARAFAADRSVVGVIGTWHSGCARDEIPILARARPPVAMISPANSNDDLTAAGRQNYLRVAPTDLEQYAAVVAYAARLGRQRLFAVGDNSFLLLGGVDVPAARLGVRVIGASDWAHSDGDALRLARHVQATHADAVLIDGSPGDDEARTISTLRHVLGPAMPMIAMGALPVPGFSASLGDAADGMYVVSEAPPAAALTRRGQAWALQFAASEKTHAVGALAPLAAQATEMLLDAIAASDGTRAGVLRHLHSAPVTNGILPDFRFTPGGDITPARFTVLRLHQGVAAGGDLQPDFGGASVIGTFSVPSFAAGLAPGRGTPIGITIGREPIAHAEMDCGNDGQPPCRYTGPFTAADAATGHMLCPSGRAVQVERFDARTFGVFGDRTLRCPDGATVTMTVRLEVGGGLTGDPTTNYGWEWVIIGGTGRLAHLRGDGISFEPRDAGHNILGGRMTGLVRTAT